MKSKITLSKQRTERSRKFSLYLGTSCHGVNLANRLKVVNALQISASSRNSNVLNYEKEDTLYFSFLTVSFTFVSFKHRDQNLEVTVVILMNAQVLVDM